MRPAALSILPLLLALSPPALALDLFLVDDGDGNTDDLVSELESWGHTVTLSSDDFGVIEYDFTGAERGLDLADYDAVIWLDGAEATWYEMPDAGQVALFDFVNGGGGLLLFGSTGYQYAYYGSYGSYGGMVPLRDSDYTGNQSWTVEVGGHPLAEGWSLGDSFTPDSGLIRDSTASSGSVVFTFTRYGDEYDAGAAVGLGAGRLVQYALWGNTTSSFSTYETNWSDGNVSQLVENALQWIVLRPPELSLDGSYTVAAESSVTLRPDSAADPDGGSVTYAWDVGRDGTTDGTATSLVFSAAGYDGPDSEAVRLTVSDDEGTSTTADTTVTITNVAPAVLSIDDSGSLSEGSGGSLSVEYVDVEAADTHTISWSFGDGATATGASTSHTWTDNGRYTVTVTVTDDDGGADSLSYTQVVTNVAPTLTGDPATEAWQGALYTFTPGVSDPGSSDTFTFDGDVPDGASLDATTGRVSWTPSADQLGDHLLRITVTDDDGATDAMNWTVTVSFLDDDGDGLPDDWEDGFGLDPGDPADALGDEDGDGRTALDEYEGGTDPTEYDGPGAPTLLSPADGERLGAVPPVLQVGNATAPLGQDLTYGFEVYADAALTDRVTSVAGRAPGSGSTTEWLLGGATLEENTDYWWTATAADDFVEGPAASPAFSFFVNAVNEAPGAPGIGSPFDGGIVETLTPDLVLTAAVDPDRDALTYRAVLRDPAGAVVAELADLPEVGGTATGTLATPLAEDTEYCWSGLAVDPGGLESLSSSTACFLVDLENDPPSAPTILSPTEGQQVEPSALVVRIQDGVDPEGRAIRHEFQLDSVASFDSAALQAAWVKADGDGTSDWAPPLALDAGATWYLRVRCDDGGAQSAWTTVTFQTAGAPGAPTAPDLLSPANGETVAGAWSYTLANAWDPDGQALTYEVLVVDRLGGTVLSGEGLPEGEGQTTWTPEALPDGVYSWTARAVDESGNASPWAQAWVFQVGAGVSGDGGADGGADSGAGMQVAGEGCGCASGGEGAGGGRALVAGLVGLLGLAWRRRRAGPA
ncbi:PKD domain-containing protein [Myxococcota bacterium]|nr:PKD domain-containing protein [Myxococcota bacterium]